jgi:TatA/E family protein of Tat protein translocase
MGIENPVHLIFIAAVALIVLGPKRLPGLARALGQGVREFREALQRGEEDDPEDDDAEEAEVAHAGTAAGPGPSPPAVAGPSPPAGPDVSPPAGPDVSARADAQASPSAPGA